MSVLDLEPVDDILRKERSNLRHVAGGKTFAESGDKLPIRFLRRGWIDRLRRGWHKCKNADQNT